MELDDLEVSRGLLSFIDASPTAFQAVEESAERLEEAGFTGLDETEAWDIEPGRGYYTTRNGSAIIAFVAPDDLSDYHFRLTASHCDSPTFKLKNTPELKGAEGYVKLNVEGYGGMIDLTWMDRPLSVAGRLIVRDGDGVKSVNVAVDKDILIIPTVAIHLNRDVNKGLPLNHQIDMCPLVSAGDLEGKSFIGLVAEYAGVDPADVLGHDLFLWNRTHATLWGFADEFISAPRIDDLQCAYASLEGFLGAPARAGVNMWVCFDNEEVGSMTKQGAMSTFLVDTMRRINLALGKGEEDFLRACAGSIMLSCDNCQAVHPNHPERTDDVNKPRLNGGVVIKEAANQKYTTDGVSRALFLLACEDAGVEVQTYTNRSDATGGSTLGNLANTQVSMDTIDIGLCQLSMHSSYETSGARDTVPAIRAIASFYAKAPHRH